MTLAHESMHLRGWLDEASAQCYGLQELAYVTQQLGGSAEQGRAVTAYVLSMQGGMPSEYQSSAVQAVHSTCIRTRPSFRWSPFPGRRPQVGTGLSLVRPER